MSLGGGGEAINANDCPLLIPASEGGVFQPDPDLPNYNPHVSTLNFGSCATSSDNFVTSGELALLGYPGGGDPLVPGDSTNQNVKLTDFDHPYQENSSGDLVPFDDSSIGSSEFTYFARAALIKDWELWHAELVYERSNDDSGSFGASSVQDSFEATVRWNPAPLWSVQLVGAYTMIDQASDVTVPTSLVLENGPVPAGVDSVSQVATVQRLVVQADSNAVSYTTESVALIGHAPTDADLLGLRLALLLPAGPAPRSPEGLLVPAVNVVRRRLEHALTSHAHALARPRLAVRNPQVLNRGLPPWTPNRASSSTT